MHIDRRFLNWGVFFILLGLVPLAIQLRWLEADAVIGWWRLWPLLLVGAGIGLVLRRTPLSFAGGLLVAATFGLMLGGALAGGGTGDFGFACGPGTATTPFATQGGTFGSNASVSLEVNCGELATGTSPGAGWTLSGTAPDGRGPAIEASADRLEVRQARRAWFGPFDPAGGRETWTLTLPTDPMLALSATLNAGSARYDLTGARLSSMSMTVNAGSVTADLSGATVDSMSATLNAGSMKVGLPAVSASGSFTVNAGSLGFCVAPGAGLRISTNDSFLASNNFAERGLTKSGSTWTTPGFDAAATKIELSATANVGRIELDPEGGCR